MKKNTKVNYQNQEDTKEQFQISEKHIPLRVAIFIISLILGIGGIGFGIYSLLKSNDKDGWNLLLLEDYKDSKYVGYEDNIVLGYYVSSGGAIGNVKKLFQSSAKEVYSVIDANPTHTYDVPNIGYLNVHRGEKVEINETLFNILSDAKEKTYSQDSAYSVYAGLTYNFWRSEYSSNYILSRENDPCNNNDLREKLEDITNVTKKLDNFSLDLKKEGESYYATFSISEEVENLLDEYGFEDDLETFSILDLNTLFYSYYLDYMNSRFQNEGYTGGYLTTYTGEYIFMSNGFDRAFNNVVYSYDAQRRLPISMGYFSKKGSFVSSQIRSFGVFEYDNGFASYIASDNNGDRYFRNLYFDYRTGCNTQKIFTSFLSDDSKNARLQDVTFQNLNMYSNGEISSYSIKNSNQYLIVTLTEEKDTVYLSENDSRYIDFGYLDDEGKEQTVSYTRKLI